MDDTRDRFSYAATMLLMILAAMIPLWFLPLPLPVALEFGREVAFSLIIMAAFILWLLSLLTRGEMRYPSSILLWIGGLLAVAFGASTFFSKAPLVSLTYGDPLAEKFSTLLLGLILMVVSSCLYIKEKDIKRFLGILIMATGISGVIAFFQLAWGISLLGYISSYGQGASFNVIGTMNGFALFLVTMFIVTLGLLFSSLKIKTKGIYILTAVLLILMLDLMMIHFHTAWMVLLGSLIFFFGLMFMRMRGIALRENIQYGGSRIRGLDWRYSILILLIALCVVMLVVKTPVFGSANLPAEVSPSFSATLSIGKQVFNANTRQMLLGSGPTTFNLDWAQYRDPLINQTQFWNVLFTQGFSWFATLAPTVGIFGILAFMLFAVTAVWLFLRHLLNFPNEERAPIGVSLFVGFIALILIAILYPATLTFVFMFFFFAGILMSLLARPEVVMHEHEEEGTVHLGFEQISAQEGGIEKIAASREKTPRTHRWWDIVSRTVPFESSWMVFISSLGAIFFLSLGVAGMYLEMARLRGALTQQNGVVLFNKGDIDGSIAVFEQAVSFEDKNFSNYIPLVQARMEKIRNLIGRASGGNNVQQEFQNTVSVTIKNIQQATNLNPSNPLLWKLQGSLYELLIPFIPGSENVAFSSYRKAMEFDPLNPSLNIDLARAGLIAVDRLTLTIQQAHGNDRDQMTVNRNTALQEILSVLQKAVDLKPDLPDSYFLTTQAALRLGNLAVAIQSAEKTKLAAPFDIGVAFQLGLLYYQVGEIDKAQIEFERSVAINNNYSNARYFLGLIYDRKGDTSRAIQQFDQIGALNPDNQEVKHILNNLHVGKPALDGIVPPAQPPEKRNTTPVTEGGGKESK